MLLTRPGSFIVLTLTVSMLLARLDAHDTADEMARAAESLLATLEPAQRERTMYPFDHDERENWHYVPRSRRGLPLKEMNASQRAAARTLLATTLSDRGLATTTEIMGLETVLAALENNPLRRDPQNYFFTVFGSPGDGPWGWRCEGHHVSLNLTIVGDEIIVATPHFLGANPAEVRSGERKGSRALGPEEDLGRAFVTSLDADQRQQAVIAARAPADIINEPGRADSQSEGIAISALNSAQRDALLHLVRWYVERFRPEIADDAMQHLTDAGTEALHFAWAGGLEPGMPHYYRIQSAWFVIEYDNTQNDANHVHTVWREFGREFGRDALREHYESDH